MKSGNDKPVHPPSLSGTGVFRHIELITIGINAPSGCVPPSRSTVKHFSNTEYDPDVASVVPSPKLADVVAIRKESTHGSYPGRNSMEILHGAALGLKLRELSDNARHRVWIVSPYIGRWPAVSALLGANWWLSSTVLLRVITDIDDPTNVNRGTLIQLLDRGPVATLRGVHAKIYVVDDQAIVSSANLTETAFTKRREIGILLDAAEAKDVITLVNTWWERFATEISPDTVEKWQKASSFTPEAEGEGLPPLWGLPQKPPDGLFKSSKKEARDFASYRNFLKCYNELAKDYARVQRLWPNGALFIETDTFLNYLFHEAEGTPAFEFYVRHDPRTLTNAQRSEELAKWARRFATWVRTSQDETYRFQRCQLIRTLLAKDRLDDLSRGEIQQVVDCLHCMHSQQLIRHKFLNPANNDLEAIRKAWKILLHGKGNAEQRMQECHDALHFFGPSSVQELLGWYYPDEYPIRNSNSDAGLRFFGYRL